MIIKFYGVQLTLPALAVEKIIIWSITLLWIIENFENSLFTPSISELLNEKAHNFKAKFLNNYFPSKLFSRNIFQIVKLLISFSFQV